MKNKKEIQFFGVVVFGSAIFTGISLLFQHNSYKFFAGVLIIAYTLLQMLVGLKNNSDEGKDF